MNRFSFCQAAVVLCLGFFFQHIAKVNACVLFQFGDSLSDTGNRVTAFPDLHYPYGITFFHHPAKRVSDGRLIIDFLATSLTSGPLHPYLECEKDFSNGVNFAVNGATAVPFEKYTAVRNLTYNPCTFGFQKQVDWLLEFRGNALRSGNFSKYVFEEALYIVEMGGNDYSRMWESKWNIDQVVPFIEEINSHIAEQCRRIYNEAGGRRFMLINLPTQGCTPRSYAQALPDDEYDEYRCILRQSSIGKQHNIRLKRMGLELEKELHGSTFIYADLHGIVLDVMKNFQSYGITTRRHACCGISTPGISVDCGKSLSMNGVMYNGSACSDPSEFVFWNDNHYTDHMNSIVAEKMLKRYLVPARFEIQQPKTSSTPSRSSA